MSRLQGEQGRLKGLLLDEQRQAELRGRPESVLSDLSLLSQMSSVSFSDAHDVIVVRVIGAALQKQHRQFAGHAEPLTLVAVDFFDFETCFSGVFAGFEPQYRLTAQFKAEVDSFLVDYLRAQSMKVELYKQTARGDIDRVGTCRVPLAALLGYTRRIRQTFQLVEPNDANVVVGTVDIVAKRYRPIVSQAPSPEPSNAPGSAPSTTSDRPSYLMRCTITFVSLEVSGIDMPSARLHAQNMYYDLDEWAERISSASATRLVFAFEFATKHDRVLPHEVIRLEFSNGMKDGEAVLGHVDLALQPIAQEPFGQVDLDLPVKDAADATLSSSQVLVEWFLSEQV